MGFGRLGLLSPNEHCEMVETTCLDSLEREFKPGFYMPLLPRAVDYDNPAKCPGCGSHEWRQHNNVRICAYCRSGQ